jgi:hypothetical protein
MVLALGALAVLAALLLILQGAHDLMDDVQDDDVKDDDETHRDD